MNVTVSQCPIGASATRRSPQRLQPFRRTILVVTAVSSINTRPPASLTVTRAAIASRGLHHGWSFLIYLKRSGADRTVRQFKLALPLLPKQRRTSISGTSLQ
jgi:hypothetical protein